MEVESEIQIDSPAMEEQPTNSFSDEIVITKETKEVVVTEEQSVIDNEAMVVNKTNEVDLGENIAENLPTIALIEPIHHQPPPDNSSDIIENPTETILTEEHVGQEVNKNTIENEEVNKSLEISQSCITEQGSASKEIAIVAVTEEGKDTHQLQMDTADNVEADEAIKTTEQKLADNTNSIDDNASNQIIETDGENVVETIESPLDQDIVMDEDTVGVKRAAKFHQNEIEEEQTGVKKRKTSISCDRPQMNQDLLQQFRFLSKFKTNFETITQPELEELVLEKMIEVLLYKSTTADNAQKISLHEQQNIIFKEKLTEVKKQFRTLEHMYKSALDQIADHNKNGCTIQPVKVTRTVGIQTQSVNLVKCPTCSLRFDENITTNPSKESNNAVVEKKKEVIREKEKRVVPKLQESPPVKPTVPETVRNGTTATVSTRASAEQLKVPPLKIKRLLDNTQKVQPVTSKKDTFVDLTEEEEDTMQKIAKRKSDAIAEVPPPLTTAGTSSKSRTSNTLKHNVSKVVQTSATLARHPAPLPSYIMNTAPSSKFLKKLPPVPNVRVTRSNAGIVLSWTMELFLKQIHAEIREYQLYGYQATDSAPSTDNWKSLGSVKALKLPMAVTLTQFQHGQRYYFSVRARDIHNRYGPFSAASTWV